MRNDAQRCNVLKTRMGAVLEWTFKNEKLADLIRR